MICYKELSSVVLDIDNGIVVMCFFLNPYPLEMHSEVITGTRI